MKNKRGMILIVGGVLLIAAALILTGYNMWDERRAKQEADALVVQLKNAISAQHPVEESPTDTVVQEESDAITEVPKLPVYVLNPDMEMPIKTIDAEDYIGVLEVPSLELVLPIISEWSYPALKVSPCRYKGSAYKDNLVIAAHNYRSHFGRLEDLQEGEEILFTDMDGNVFRYQVALTEILIPTAIEEMTNGEWDLTLFTCTLGGQYRVTVRCDRVE